MSTAIIPATMRAIDPPLPGGPELLGIVERETPAPLSSEVLIRVHAAGINRLDVLQRRGHYPPPAGTTSILGLEAAGEVVGVGADVTELAIGDAVTALVTGGGYADYVAAPAAQCLPVPPGLRFAEAASLPETWFTVWANLSDLGQIKPGEWLLVHGGTSGIGATAIDFARLFGNPIIVTCGTQAKTRAALALGATHAIDYTAGDFAREVRTLTGNQGVNVVLDMVGGEYLPRNLACLAADGRHISIAFQKGRSPEIDLLMVMQQRLRLTGSMLRGRTIDEKRAIRDALLENVWPHFSEGSLKAHLFREFPLEQAAEAHRLMESGGHIGKIVLTLR